MQSAFVIVTLFLVASPPAASPEDVDRFLRVSGFAEQLGQLPGLVSGGFEQSLAGGVGASAAPLHVAGIKSAIPEVYAADRALAEVRAQLLKNVDPTALKDTLEFYKTPFALKVTALEVQGSTVKAQAEIQRYGRTLQKTPPPAQRLKLMRDLDSVTHGTETGLDAMVGTVKGMLTASQALMPADRRLDAMQMARVLGDLRTSKQAFVEQTTLVTNLYIYRSLSDAELVRYTAFYQSPAGVSMIATTREAVKVTMAKLALDLGDISAALAAKYPPR